MASVLSVNQGRGKDDLLRRFSRGSTTAKNTRKMIFRNSFGFVMHSLVPSKFIAGSQN